MYSYSSNESKIQWWNKAIPIYGFLKFNWSSINCIKVLDAEVRLTFLIRFGFCFLQIPRILLRRIQDPPRGRSCPPETRSRKSFSVRHGDQKGRLGRAGNRGRRLCHGRGKKKISSVDKVNKGRTKNFCYTLNCLRELVCFSGLRMSLFISTSRQRSLPSD